MGHIRLGQLPDTKPWRAVVAHIAGGESAAVVAASTSTAAVRGLERGRTDRGVARVIFLLARSALAARQTDFAVALEGIGITVPPEPSLFDLTAGLTTALQNWHCANPGARTDLGEMATLAATETLADTVGDRTVGLFPTGEEVQTAVYEFSTLNGFARLGHEYYARFIRRFLLYHLGRELSQHVGGCGRFADHVAHAEFVADLSTHCREAAVIVRRYAGKWYDKKRFETGITEAQARYFSSRCLEKVRDELVIRGTRGG